MMGAHNKYWNTGLAKGADPQKISEYKERVNDGGPFRLRSKLWIALAVLAFFIKILTWIMK